MFTHYIIVTNTKLPQLYVNKYRGLLDIKYDTEPDIVVGEANIIIPKAVAPWVRARSIVKAAPTKHTVLCSAISSIEASFFCLFPYVSSYVI